MENAAAESPEPMSISFRLLLGIYLILPVCLAACLVDRFALGSALLRALPRSPGHFFLFAIFFGTPHIVASTVILATNKEYFLLYRRRLAILTLAIVALAAAGRAALPFEALYAVVATATIVHVVRQQIGIGNAAGRADGAAYEVWSLLLIVSSVVLFNAIFLNGAFSAPQLRWAGRSLVVFALSILAAAALAHPRVPSRTGKYFLWANTAMTLSSFIFYLRGYVFFAVLGPRVIHDVTAFVFYVAHDHNRNLERPLNWLYRLLGKARIGAVVAVPALAVLLTWFLERRADGYLAFLTTRVLGLRIQGAIAGGFVGYLGLVHYYTEAVTWKAGSPYRRYIHLVGREPAAAAGRS
jgi:hypothetical protein